MVTDKMIGIDRAPAGDEDSGGPGAGIPDRY
jgi:hypothetical protein